MQSVLAKIAYFGKPFHGFARQPKTLTVQGNIEDALHTIFKRDVETTCAGRTDAGVHANANYVSFDITQKESENPRFLPSRLQESLDALTHDDIHVRDVSVYDREFSARFDAKSREYSYFICNQATPSVVMRDTSWHIRKSLDVDKMQEAAEHLIGEHDFKSFCVAESAKKLDSTSRCVFEITVGQCDYFGDKIVEIHVRGNAFLHSMVRTIVGTLVPVGLGKKSPSTLAEILNAKDRTKAGECAPAKGLCLMNVRY